jgi:glycine cleavage system H protein
MDGFTYNNIFETKGIEYLVIITFFAILIFFWITLNKQVQIRKRIQKTLGSITANALKIPQGIFFSENHTWTHMGSSGVAKVGLDDLLMHITGEVKFNNLRNQGEKINKGDLLAEISQKGKILRIFSPISGDIVDTNPVLTNNPELLNEDPYKIGWMYEIKPSNWIEDTNAYYLAGEATSWIEKELEMFKDFLAISLIKLTPASPNLILQDGGELTDNILSDLPDEVWQQFQEDFLSNTDSGTKHRKLI